MKPLPSNVDDQNNSQKQTGAPETDESGCYLSVDCFVVGYLMSGMFKNRSDESRRNQRQQLVILRE
jgi:hypothetical protein